MLRRDLATMLVASAAGSALIARTASAQSCLAPCYPQTAAEAAANITSPTTTYLPGDVRRYGGVGNGVADDTNAIQQAHTQGKQLNGARPYLPPGRWRITDPIDPCSLGMYGDGPRSSIIECHGCDTFFIPTDESLWNRRSGAFELFGIDGSGTSCYSNFAFSFPGAGGSTSRNSGFTVRDLAIDGMGGGFRLQDVFRVSVENVGFTAVFCMIYLKGSVVQASFRNVRSFNNELDGREGQSGLPRYGVWTERDGDWVCENVTFTDCVYVRGERGIHHTAGLCVTFNNFDAETTHFGAYIGAECTMRGGILGSSERASAWIGIARGTAIPASYNGTIFDGVDINTLYRPTAPTLSYGFELGDGSGAVHGLVIRNCRIRGTPSSLAHGIRGRVLRDATIEDNFFETECFYGTALSVQGRRLFVNRNRIPEGRIEVQDGGDTLACGEIEYNECAALVTTLTTPARWTVRNF